MFEESVSYLTCAAHSRGEMAGRNGHSTCVFCAQLAHFIASAGLSSGWEGSIRPPNPHGLAGLRAAVLGSGKGGSDANCDGSVGFRSCSCATAPQGKHIIQRQALAQIEPAERDNLFGLIDEAEAKGRSAARLGDAQGTRGRGVGPTHPERGGPRQAGGALLRAGDDRDLSVASRRASRLVVASATPPLRRLAER